MPHSMISQPPHGLMRPALPDTDSSQNCLAMVTILCSVPSLRRCRQQRIASDRYPRVGPPDHERLCWPSSAAGAIYAARTVSAFEMRSRAIVAEET